MMVRTTGESVDESFVLLRGLLHYTDQEVRPSLNQPQPLGALTPLLCSPMAYTGPHGQPPRARLRPRSRRRRRPSGWSPAGGGGPHPARRRDRHADVLRGQEDGPHRPGRHAVRGPRHQGRAARQAGTGWLACWGDENHDHDVTRAAAATATTQSAPEFKADRP